MVDEFSTDGRLIARIATGGPLDTPWGLAIAPSGWGHVAGALLVGNFGNGRISIFPARGDHFAHHASGQILDASTGQPFADALWFAAGIAGPDGGQLEQGGRLGVLRP